MTGQDDGAAQPDTRALPLVGRPYQSSPDSIFVVRADRPSEVPPAATMLQAPPLLPRTAQPPVAEPFMDRPPRLPDALRGRPETAFDEVLHPGSTITSGQHAPFDQHQPLEPPAAVAAPSVFEPPAAVAAPPAFEPPVPVASDPFDAILRPPSDPGGPTWQSAVAQAPVAQVPVVEVAAPTLSTPAVEDLHVLSPFPSRDVAPPASPAAPVGPPPLPAVAAPTAPAADLEQVATTQEMPRTPSAPAPTPVPVPVSVPVPAPANPWGSPAARSNDAPAPWQPPAGGAAPWSQQPQPSHLSRPSAGPSGPPPPPAGPGSSPFPQNAPVPAPPSFPTYGTHVAPGTGGPGNGAVRPTPAGTSGTSGLAIAAFVLGLLGGVVLAPVFAIVALRRVGRTGQRGKGLAIAGLVLSLVWAGVIAFGAYAFLSAAHRDPTGQVTAAGSVTSSELRKGDCLASWAVGAQSVTTLQVTPCTTPHKAQVFAELDLAAGTYPGDAGAAAAADKQCNAIADRYTWNDVPAGSRLSYLYPRKEGWARGDRQVTCVVVMSTAATGSAAAAQG